MTSANELDQIDPDIDKIARARRAFLAYRDLSLQVFDSQALSFEELSDADKTLIPDIPLRLSHAAEAIEHNADVIERIASLVQTNLSDVDDELQPHQLEQTVADFPDVVDALLAVVRDWTSHGQKDRMLTYDPIIHAVGEAADDAVDSNLISDRTDFSVLVPGASLGRLSWELANLGFSVQGVESSYLQLFVCNFIMNSGLSDDKPLHLYPFAHHTGMLQSIDDQVKEIEFPDVDPRSLQNSNFSMVAGEFLEHYTKEKTWDCVATCFCIENSHSIISYIRRIATILKPGGTWINHGCMDFKYDDSQSDPSIEITSEEFDLIVARCGLRVLKRETQRCRPPYAVSGMIQEEYESILTVAVRV